MVLTHDSVYFAKPDSDLVLDQFALKNVSIISKVDRAQNALAEASKINSGQGDKDIRRSINRRGSVKFSSTLKLDSIVDLQDGTKETHAFEVRLSSESANDTTAHADRSYFVRVESPEECEKVDFPNPASLQLSPRRLSNPIPDEAPALGLGA